MRNNDQQVAFWVLFTVGFLLAVNMSELHFKYQKSSLFSVDWGRQVVCTFKERLRQDMRRPKGDMHLHRSGKIFDVNEFINQTRKV